MAIRPYRVLVMTYRVLVMRVLSIGNLGKGHFSFWRMAIRAYIYQDLRKS